MNIDKILEKTEQKVQIMGIREKKLNYLGTTDSIYWLEKEEMKKTYIIEVFHMKWG